jgi:hypothetical protein
MTETLCNFLESESGYHDACSGLNLEKNSWEKTDKWILTNF